MVNSISGIFSISRWFTFDYFVALARDEEDMPMGNPGPINNLPLVYLVSRSLTL
jgi:hypothetical protein